MARTTDECFDLLLEQAGLRLTPHDKQELKSLFARFQERTRLLHSADVEAEEVAGVFSPGPAGEV